MSVFARASFLIEPFEKTYAITPYVDGDSLVEMVSMFEREKGFEPLGGYGGLIPQYFNYGPLDNYFSGNFEPDSYFAKMGRAYLLGCDCGEVGCWPLAAQIVCKDRSVKWGSFRQEHRPDRDYSAFGPFVFDVDQYLHAVAELLDQSSLWRG